MEYIQTVLVQIEASRLERASESGGLLAELDEHRSYLKQQPGFRDLRITRSINPEGNVLVVVETRWSDDESLVRYETSEPNAASIVRRHTDVVVSDSLQVLDMEALRTESSFAHEEAALSARQRVLLPVVVPVGVLAFILLVVYSLSRIYLDLGGNNAVALAAGIAISILAIAAYLAYNPRVSAPQIGFIFVAVVALLIGGATWALLDNNEATGHEPAAVEPGASPSSAPVANAITLGDNFFEFGGQKAPTIPVTAGKEVTLEITNTGKAIHNMHVAGGGTFDTDICDPKDTDPCSSPNQIRAGKTATIKFTINEPGTYDFRCDFHYTTGMTGKIEVK
jgi:plastocyanin/heme-degrading monooxygenase HmoA